MLCHQYMISRLFYFFPAKFLSQTYPPECLKVPLQERYDMSLYWFKNITVYMQDLTYVRSQLVKDMKRFIADKKDHGRETVIMYTSIMVLVVLSCSITTSVIYKMTKQVN